MLPILLRICYIFPPAFTRVGSATSLVYWGPTLRLLGPGNRHSPSASALAVPLQRFLCGKWEHGPVAEPREVGPSSPPSSLLTTLASVVPTQRSPLRRESVGFSSSTCRLMRSMAFMAPSPRAWAGRSVRPSRPTAPGPRGGPPP